MDIFDAASYFDQDEIRDAYTNQLLFYGHTSPHDDHTSSGATSRRRTLTAAVDTAAPARRAISWYGDFWLIGGSNPDAFQGERLRRNYGLKKSTGLLRLLTPAQAALGQSGLGFHAHKEYYRDMTNGLSTAEFDTMWNVFCPYTEPVVKGSFFREPNGTIYRARVAYPTVDEYVVAETDQLDPDAFQAVTFTMNGPLDVATDTIPTISIATTVVQTDISKYYQFRTEAEGGQKAGDRTVFVAQSVLTPKPGAQFTMLGMTWRVVLVVPEGDSWALLARRV